MSTTADSLPPGASMPTNIQRSTTHRAETESPLPSLPIPTECPPPEQRTGDPDSSSQRTTSDANSATSTRPSFASLTFANPEATPDFPPSDTSFTPEFGPGGLGPPTQSISPANASIHHGPVRQVPLPPAFPHAGGYGFLPLLQHDSIQPQHRPRSDASAYPNLGVGSRFNIGGGPHMFGLEPFGYTSSAPFFPSVSLFEGGGNDQAQSLHHFADTDMESGGVRADAAIPDFTLMDDALTMWSSMPPTFG